MVKVGYMGTMNAATNMSSMSQAFTPMMGVMIGMFLSSCNPVIGTYVGALSITIVSSGLVALGIESRLQNVVVGIFLLIFIGYKSNISYIRKLFHLKGPVRQVKLPI
jgi:ribose transport system permease protein